MLIDFPLDRVNAKKRFGLSSPKESEESNGSLINSVSFASFKSNNRLLIVAMSASVSLGLMIQLER